MGFPAAAFVCERCQSLRRTKALQPPLLLIYRRRYLAALQSLEKELISPTIQAGLLLQLSLTVSGVLPVELNLQGCSISCLRFVLCIFLSFFFLVWTLDWGFFFFF
uniref:Uncharacterized protein n=1 Tax=Rhizophora mucronata TaxID=61149 RepID=A0A2P2M5Y5_RHIMU